MDHTLRPYTNEMWATLEDEQSSSSGCSTCLSPSPSPPEVGAQAEIDIKTELTAQSSLPAQRHRAASTRSPRRGASEGSAVPPTPTTPKSYPDIDPQHLDPLQTLAAVATCSPGSLYRLTTQGQSQTPKNMDNIDKQALPIKEDEEEEEGSFVSSRSPHHTRSPRSYANHHAHQDAKRQSLPKSQREAMPRTSRATHQNRHREVVSPARNLRRRPSPSSASPSPQFLSRTSSQSLHFQAQQSHTQSQSQSISGPSCSKLPSGDRHDIVVRYPQAKGSRRPALDISSERLLASLRDQLRESQFPRYTMPHPKRDGASSGKKWRCTYDFETGGRCNVACSRKGEARRHAFTHEIHLRWICPSLAVDASSCGKLFARQDAAIRHIEQSKSCKDLAANRSEGFPVLVWEEEDEIVAKIVTLEWNEDDNNEGDE